MKRRIRVMRVASTIYDFVFGTQPHNAATLIIGSGMGTLTVNDSITAAALDALLAAAAEYCAVSTITVVRVPFK